MAINPIKNRLKKAWLKSDLRGIETGIVERIYTI